MIKPPCGGLCALVGVGTSGEAWAGAWGRRFVDKREPRACGRKCFRGVTTALVGANLNWRTAGVLLLL